MPKLIFANRASSQLNADITALDTSLVVSPGTGSRFPSPGVNEAFRLTLTDQNGQSEIVECTARTGDQLFVTRGVEGTTPRAFSAGSRVELRLTAGTMASFLQGGALPPLSQDLNFNGFRPINVPWATMTLDVDQIRERGVALVPVTRNIAVGAGLLGGGNLGSDLTLALDFATSADMVAGTSTTKVVTPARIAELTSPQFSSTVALPAAFPAIVDVGHTLGAMPRWVNVWFVARAANNNYPAGARVPLWAARRATDPHVVPSFSVTASTITIHLPNNMRMAERTASHTMFDVTGTNWELLVEAGRY